MQVCQWNYHSMCPIQDYHHYQYGKLYSLHSAREHNHFEF
nr:MAG TPA: hypothetical protein [Caudoviricetes sp.]